MTSEPYPPVRPVLLCYCSASCFAASLRALSRERRAADTQPQVQRAVANEPFSLMVVLWVTAAGAVPGIGDGGSDWSLGTSAKVTRDDPEPCPPGSRNLRHLLSLVLGSPDSGGGHVAGHVAVQVLYEG